MMCASYTIVDTWQHERSHVIVNTINQALPQLGTSRFLFACAIPSGESRGRCAGSRSAPERTCQQSTREAPSQELLPGGLRASGSPPGLALRGPPGPMPTDPPHPPMLAWGPWELGSGPRHKSDGFYCGLHGDLLIMSYAFSTPSQRTSTRASSAGPWQRLLDGSGL